MGTLLRIKEFIDAEGISVRAFEMQVGMSNGSFGSQLKRNASIGVDRLENILRFFPQLSPEWVLTGSGSMLRDFSNAYIQEKVGSLRLNEESGAYDRVPLVDRDAVAGHWGSDFTIELADIQAFYVVPDFQNIQFMLRVQGSSMYPKYTAGDIVACRILTEPNFIQWNKAHVIVTGEQGILLKRLKPGKQAEHYLLVSDNKEYDAFEIRRDACLGIALVVGVIRVE